MSCKIFKIFIVILFATVATSYAQKNNLLPDTIRYCKGDSTIIEIMSHFNKKVVFSWETPLGYFTNTRKVRPYKPGKYYVKLSSPMFSRPLIDSAYVRVYTRPTLRLKDTIICAGSPVMLNAQNPGMSYLWSTGETTQRIKITSQGKYWVKITNGYCWLNDTVTIKSPDYTGTNVNNEVVFCLNDEIKPIGIKTMQEAKVVWNTGAITPTIHATHAGVYWVKTSGGACGERCDTIKVKLKACECEMFIPNSFTPNEDNRNDYFFPVTQCEYSYYQLTISDRWGNTVFTTYNVNAKWDGRFKGNLCSEDIYTYHIECAEKLNDKKTVRNGHISLFR